MEAAGDARRLDHTRHWCRSCSTLQGHARRLLLFHAKHWRKHGGALALTGPAIYDGFVGWQGVIAPDLTTFVSLQTRKELEQHNLQ